MQSRKRLWACITALRRTNQEPLEELSRPASLRVLDTADATTEVGGVIAEKITVIELTDWNDNCAACSNVTCGTAASLKHSRKECTVAANKKFATTPPTSVVASAVSRTRREAGLEIYSTGS